MEQIKNKLPEAVSTLTNGGQNSIQLNRPAPSWLPVEVNQNYNGTDLTYDFCVKLFAQLEASKREKIPPETARQWFIEFVRRGWTKEMLQKRYNAILSTKIYGVEKLDFADWVNAVEVYAMDEINIMVKQRIDQMISRGRWLKDQKIELSQEEKRCIDLWAAKDAELEHYRKKSDAMDDYRTTRRKLFSSKYHEAK